MADERTAPQSDEPIEDLDLELRDDDAAKVVGGATADRSTDAGLHMKYDLKAQKEG